MVSARKKTIFVLLCVALCAMLVFSIGVTAALWDSEGGASGYAPGAMTVDWNTWAKYFEYEAVSADGVTPQEIFITGYSGTNLTDVVIPSVIDGKIVTGIRNTVFASSTLKALPVTLQISPYVTTIEDSAFSGLKNLKKVVFGGLHGVDISMEKYKTLDCGAQAFLGCTALETVVLDTDKNLKFSFAAFAGCPFTQISDSNGTNILNSTVFDLAVSFLIFDENTNGMSGSRLPEAYGTKYLKAA